MFNIEPGVVAWLIGWSFVGSTLGFFTIRNKPQWTTLERFKEYIRSISVGIFFAISSYVVLQERELFNGSISIIVAGGIAFSVTDIIINFWPRLVEGIGVTATKIIDRLIGKI